jgi:hypothetical protein
MHNDVVFLCSGFQLAVLIFRPDVPWIPPPLRLDIEEKLTTLWGDKTPRGEKSTEEQKMLFRSG